MRGEGANETVILYPMAGPEPGQGQAVCWCESETPMEVLENGW